MFGFGLQSIEPIDMMIVLGIRISFERKNYACSRTVYAKTGYRIWQTSCTY
jgi:hypothetical protein